MKPPRIPLDEEARLEALRAHAVLDTPPEEVFDGITRLAASLLRVPIALVSLVDAERQWFKSRVGLDATQTPRDVSFCGHVVADGAPLIVPDAFDDPRFADNPLVTGAPHVRFYAGMPLRTADGHVLGTLCVIDHQRREVTPADQELLRVLADHAVMQLDLRRSARQHQQQHARLQALLRTMQEGVVVQDVSGAIIECNPAAERILGLSVDQMRGRTSVDPRWRSVREDGSPFPGEEHPAMVALRTGRPLSGVIMGVHRPDEGQVWIAVDAVPLPPQFPEDLPAVLATFRDVTTERTARQALARQFTFLRTLLDSLPGTTLLLFDEALRLQALFGSEGAGQDVGGALIDWVAPSEREAVAAAARRCLDGERVRAHATRGTRRYELGFVPVPEEGRRTGLLLAHDVTERDLLQERLARQDRLVTTGTLAAGIGHELNNPLSYVIGNLDFAAEELETIADPPAAAQLEGLLESIVEAREGAERIRKIIQGLRAFARESSDRVPVNVHDVIEVSLNLGVHELRPRCTVERDLSEVPLVLGEEARLSQVLLNLVVNAAQCFPTADPAKNRVVVRTRAVDGWVSIEVSDNGPGIPPEVLPRIWDPFFTTKPVGIGTGLGLSICHSIVTSLDGQLTCDTAVGRGTTFRVLLPAARTSTEAAPGAPTTKGRVLVVDDEPLVLRSITRLLKGRHEVVVLEDPREALRRIEAGESFDVVISDIMMPHLRGDELFARVRRIRPALAERFVFITGGVRTSALSDILAGLSNEVLEKPLDTEQLRRVVRRFIGE